MYMLNFKRLLLVLINLLFCYLNINAQFSSSSPFSQPQKVVNNKKTKIEVKTAEQFFDLLRASALFNDFFNMQLHKSERINSLDGNNSLFIPEKFEYIIHNGINFINQYDSNLFFKFKLKNINEILIYIDSVIAKGDDPNYENIVLYIDPILRQKLLNQSIYFDFTPIDIQVDFTRFYEDNSKSKPIVYLATSLPFSFFKPEFNQVASVYQFIGPRIEVKAFNIGIEAPLFESQFIVSNSYFIFPNR